MLVIGTEVVERYFSTHSGHKGINAARTQYNAWLAIAAAAQWRNPGDVKRSYPKASILEAKAFSAEVDAGSAQENAKNVKNLKRIPTSACRNRFDISGMRFSRVVFNIKGNDYRLIAALQYAAGVLAIRFFGTHSEYDEVDAEAV